jgi:hypothetical protein
VATDVKKEHQIKSKLHKKSETSKKKKFRKKSCHHNAKIRPKKEMVVSIAKSQRQMEK